MFFIVPVKIWIKQESDVLSISVLTRSVAKKIGYRLHYNDAYVLGSLATPSNWVAILHH